VEKWGTLLNMNKKKILVLFVLLLGSCVIWRSWSLYHTEKEKKQASERKIEAEKDSKPVTSKSEKEEPVKREPTKEELLEQEVEAKIRNMSAEEKVAQLFMITPEALTGVGQVVAAGESTKAALEACPVGGIIYFAQNFESPQQVKQMTANVQQYSRNRIGLPLFLSVDEEGGTVTRFGRNPAFQFDASVNMRELGRTGNTQAAYNLGTKLGTFLSDLGFNMDNAPVADVLSNPQNTVIGNRSFGSDCHMVSDMALAELKGMKDTGVIGVLKHYPGHGATTADTHTGYASTDATLEEMKGNELVPFIEGIRSGAEVIMVAHISCPGITGDTVPASLSKKMITDILRTDLGYQGLVITDALNMGAIAQEYTSGEAAVLAINAGADMLLMPVDFHEAYEAVLSAMQSGEISESRIEESLKRILSLKLCMDAG